MPNVGTAGTYGNATDFPIITVDAQGRVTTVTTTPASAPTSLSSTTNATTTSATYATIATMTTTPAAGDYRVDFTCSAAIDTDSNGDIALFIGATEQTVTRRNLGSVGSGATVNTAEATLSFVTLITVTGAQVVSVQFRENSGGTFTIRARELILTKI